MVAINLSYASLVLRYSEGELPPPNEPWNCFPFTNERFRELAGIESVSVGLSKPPTGKLGQSLSASVLSQWPQRAKGAINFLRDCDEHYRKYKKAPSIEIFQKDVLNKALYRMDWTWVVEKFFGVPGGLYDKLEELMRDHQCDAEEAYRRARDDLVSSSFGFED
jgi:hypothetical protein